MTCVARIAVPATIVGVGAGVRGREQEILDGALDLFSRQGYRETSLQEIADRLGITRPAFYYYFRSKEEILWRLVEDLGYRLLDQATPVARGGEPPSERLRALMVSHARTVLQNAAAFRVYFQERGSLEGPRDEQLKRGEHAYAALIADLITEGQRAGVFRPGDAGVLALLVIGLANSPLRWFTPSGRLTVDALAEQIGDVALAGLLTGK